jgi:hypothetical protein
LRRTSAISRCTAGEASPTGTEGAGATTAAPGVPGADGATVPVEGVGLGAGPGPVEAIGVLDGVGATVGAGVAVGAVVGAGVGATAVVDVPEELGAGEALAPCTGADVAQNRTAASGRARASLSSEAS